MTLLVKRLMLFTLMCLAFSLFGCDGCSSPTEPDPETPMEVWDVLIIDDDEGFPANLDTLSVLITDTGLIFRLDTHSAWANPYDPDNGVNAAIFLDTDANPSTGLSATSTYMYYPNDIGADFAILVGIEGDALFSWDPGWNKWSNPVELTSLMLDTDTTRFEVEVNFEMLLNPDLLHVVAATVSWVDQESMYDFGPDEGHGIIDIGPQASSTDPPFVARPATDIHEPPVTAWR